LLREGKPVGAVEVYVTHRVDDTKAEALATLGVPWVEVKGDVSLMSGDIPWTTDRSLPGHRRSGNPIWRCSDHAREQEEWLAAQERRRWYEAQERELAEKGRAEREAQERERVAELSRHSTIVRGVRIVDFYLHNGRARRRFYLFVEHRLDGEVVDFTLEQAGMLGRWAYDPSSKESKRAMWKQVEECFTGDCIALQREEGSRADSPMDWAFRADVEAIMSRLTSSSVKIKNEVRAAFPPRYLHDPQQGGWVMQPGFESVRWDALRDGVMTRHPALNRQRRR
jgi:hypothetical protein